MRNGDQVSLALAGIAAGEEDGTGAALADEVDERMVGVEDHILARTDGVVLLNRCTGYRRRFAARASDTWSPLRTFPRRLRLSSHYLDQ